jgi:hypothetical protein
MNGFSVEGCTIKDNNLTGISSNPSGNYRPNCTNFSIQNTTFENNNRLTANNSHDLSIFGFNGDLNMKNVTISCNHVANKQVNGSLLTVGGWGLAIYGSIEGNVKRPSGKIILDNVVMSGTVIKSGFGIDRYSSVDLSVNNVDLANLKANGANQTWSQMNIGTPEGSINLNNTKFTTLVNNNLGTIYAQDCVIYDLTSGSVLNRNIPSELLQIRSQVYDKDDLATLGKVVVGGSDILNDILNNLNSSFSSAHPLELEEKYGLSEDMVYSSGVAADNEILLVNMSEPKHFKNFSSSSFTNYNLTQDVKLACNQNLNIVSLSSSNVGKTLTGNNTRLYRDDTM